LLKTVEKTVGMLKKLWKTLRVCLKDWWKSVWSLWKSFRSVEKAVDIISGLLKRVIGKALGLLKKCWTNVVHVGKTVKKAAGPLQELL
jgi:hypothetical protein